MSPSRWLSSSSTSALLLVEFSSEALGSSIVAVSIKGDHRARGNKATACSVYGLDRLSPALDSPDDAQVCPPHINKYGDEPPQAELSALLEREAALSL
ncbi:hypothetical protein PtB15_12B460 [Puccinia triticina]|nr:hypothetical protein PtB15_12B460 [Puccinia triticina]